MRLLSGFLLFALLLPGCHPSTTVTKDTPNADNEEFTFWLCWITQDSIKVFYSDGNWPYIKSKGGEHQRIGNGYLVTGMLVNSMDPSVEEFSGVLHDEQIKEVTMMTGVKASNDWQITPANRDRIETVSLIELRGDSLCIRSAGRTRWIHVDSIAEIKKAGNSHSRLAAAIGFVGGGVIGALIGHFADSKEGLFSALPTAAGLWIGGATGGAWGVLTGSLADQDEVFFLSREDTRAKRRTIRYLMSR